MGELWLQNLEDNPFLDWKIVLHGNFRSRLDIFAARAPFKKSVVTIDWNRKNVSCQHFCLRNFLRYIVAFFFHLEDAQHYTVFSSNISDALTQISQTNHTSCSCSWTPFPAPPLSGSSASEADLIRWTHQFWVTGLVLAIGWYGYGAAVTIADAIAFSVVESSPVATTYGANRVLGTMGWAVCALLIGLLLDTFSETSSVADRDFTPAFVTFAVVLAAAIVATFFLRKVKEPEGGGDGELARTVGRSLFTLDVLLFWYVKRKIILEKTTPAWPKYSRTFPPPWVD